MKRQITFNDSIDKAMNNRASQLEIPLNEFVNIAVQNLVNMSKNGLPEPVKITEFNWENK